MFLSFVYDRIKVELKIDMKDFSLYAQGGMRMKIFTHWSKKLLSALAAFAFFALPSFAKQIYLPIYGDDFYVEVPDDIASLVEEHLTEIQDALTENGITAEQVKTTMDTVNEEYEKLKTDYFATDTPYQTIVNGLNGFCDDLNDTLPNTQTLQNVWAESWIGMLIPNVKFGFGVNAGVATLDISNLLEVADALAIDTGDIRDFTENYDNKLVFPTVAADLRIGGIILPFDLGVSFVTFDTRDWNQIDSNIAPCAFDYFTLGGDLRWKLFNLGGKFFHVRGSLSGGGYYTKGGVEVSDDDIGAGANLDFRSTTLFAGFQMSAKALCFVPFVGGRLLFTKSSVDWEAKANWSKILEGASSAVTTPSGDVIDPIQIAIDNDILPTKFSGGSSSSWGVRPQLYGGLGIDLFIIDITVSGSYDFVKEILGGAVSVRFSI